MCELVIRILIGLGFIAGVNAANIVDAVRLFNGTDLLFNVLFIVVMSVIFTSIGTVFIVTGVDRYRNREARALWEKFQIPE